MRFPRCSLTFSNRVDPTLKCTGRWRISSRVTSCHSAAFRRSSFLIGNLCLHELLPPVTGSWVNEQTSCLHGHAANEFHPIPLVVEKQVVSTVLIIILRHFLPLASTSSIFTEQTLTYIKFCAASFMYGHKGSSLYMHVKMPKLAKKGKENTQQKWSLYEPPV